ncbi:MAG TPA: pyridoxal phosphate-dependent aminotransferase [Flavobacteriaceae bacterium]|nr:pyridoxal phosphate-dependent aminotransferase [Flavobacteriaceae bacterium]
MLSISKRGRDMPASPIRKLTPFADMARRQGKFIFHLNIGQPDIESPQIALEAVRNNHLKILSYSPSDGFESYREKLAIFYRERSDLPVETDDVIITIGGSEALLFSIAAVCDDGDEVIIPEPFYANYNGFSHMIGAKVVPVDSKFEDNFALPPIAEFEKKITDKTKAILICNPGNPTGYLYTKEEIEQLADLVKKHNLFLIADEVYREFTYDGLKHNSILKEKKIEQNAIMVDSVSKRFSMCGARIGCLVSKNEEVIATVLKFAQARLSPPTYEQIASEAALKVSDTYFTEIGEKYVARRDALVEALRKVPGVKVAEPQGAFYCIAELPVDDAENFSKWMLEHFQYHRETIMLAPASGFYSTPGSGKRQVRLAYVLEKQSLLRAVVILKHGLKAYQKQHGIDPKSFIEKS